MKSFSSLIINKKIKLDLRKGKYNQLISPNKLLSFYIKFLLKF